MSETSERRLTNEGTNKLHKMAHGSPTAGELRELIAMRAYELYKHRPAEFGDELSDWLAAEGEVVTMLLAEPQETVETTPKGRLASRTAGVPLTAKTAKGPRPRLTRRPKRNTMLNDNRA